MKIKRLKELLNEYSDDANIYIGDIDSGDIYNIDEDLFLLTGEKLNGLTIVTEGDENLNPIFEFFPSEKREKIHQNWTRIDDNMTLEEKKLVDAVRDHYRGDV